MVIFNRAPKYSTVDTVLQASLNQRTCCDIYALSIKWQTSSDVLRVPRFMVALLLFLDMRRRCIQLKTSNALFQKIFQLRVLNECFEITFPNSSIEPWGVVVYWTFQLLDFIERQNNGNCQLDFRGWRQHEDGFFNERAFTQTFSGRFDRSILQFKHGRAIAGIIWRGVLGALGSNYEPTQRVCYWWFKLGCGKNGEIWNEDCEMRYCCCWFLHRDAPCSAETEKKPLNIVNKKDNFCFLYCVAAALFSLVGHAFRPKTHLENVQ